MTNPDTAAIVAANRTVAKWMGWHYGACTSPAPDGVWTRWPAVGGPNWFAVSAPPFDVLLDPVVERLREDRGIRLTLEWWDSPNTPTDVLAWFVAVDEPDGEQVRAEHPDLATAMLLAVCAAIGG